MPASERQLQRRVRRRIDRGWRVTERDLIAAGLVEAADSARPRNRSRRLDPVVPVSREIAILGFALDYPELVELLIRRRLALGLSQAEVDHKAGWPEGYTSKLEMKLGLPIWLRRNSVLRPRSTGELVSRTAGKMSLSVWLRTLGVKLALTVDSENGG